MSPFRVKLYLRAGYQVFKPPKPTTNITFPNRYDTNDDNITKSTAKNNKKCHVVSFPSGSSRSTSACWVSFAFLNLRFLSTIFLALFRHCLPRDFPSPFLANFLLRGRRRDFSQHNDARVSPSIISPPFQCSRS